MTLPKSPMAIAVCALFLSACGGTDEGPAGPAGAAGANGSSGQTALASAQSVAAGANCAGGGSQVEAGLDSNGNGTLEASEVSSAQYVCNGIAGNAGTPGANGANGSNGLNALVDVATEPAGANCAAGGNRIESGFDANRNNALDATEVVQTRFVCNGKNGTNGTNGLNTLIVVAAEAAGANCLHGGSSVRIGVDANRNNALDGAEVAGTSFVCNGVPGGLPWNNVTTAAMVSFNLPTAPVIGDTLRFKGSAGPGWKITQNAGQQINLSGVQAWSQLSGSNWSQLRAPDGSWETYVATSQDAQLVVAVPNWESSVHVSNNGGATWSTATMPLDTIHGAAVAPNGSAIYVGSLDASRGFNRSTNGGTSFTYLTSLFGMMSPVAFNGGIVALGNTVASGASLPHISSDNGSTWSALVIPGMPAGACLSSISVSPDGRNIAVSGNGNGSCPAVPVFVSRDGGSTWTASPAVGGPFHNRNWLVSLSANGRAVVAVPRDLNNPIFVSNDGGANWTSTTGTGPFAGNFGRAVVSADGARMMIPVADTSQVHVSNNGGATWSTLAFPYSAASVAANPDLSVVYMGGSRGTFEGGVFKSVSTRATWPTTTLGVGGQLSGGAFDALELLYLGGGTWGVLSAIGSNFVIE